MIEGEEQLEPRWGRLLEQHERQGRERTAREQARRAETAWLRHLAITLGSIVALAVVVAGAWYQLEIATRTDPSRCPNPAAAKVEVYVGGWAEPDECGYFDASGQQIGGGPTYPGPITRTYGDVLHDSALELSLTGAAIVAGTAALVLHRQRVRG